MGIEEFDVRKEIVSAREELEQRMKKKIANIPPQPTLSQELFAWDSEPQRVLSEEIAFREGKEYTFTHNLRCFHSPDCGPIKSKIPYKNVSKVTYYIQMKKSMMQSISFEQMSRSDKKK